MDETKTEVKEEEKQEDQLSIEIANLKIATEAWKIENEKRKALIDREEKMMAKQEALRALGGGSPAGARVELSPVEKKKREAMEFFKGSGIEKSIERHG